MTHPEGPSPLKGLRNRLRDAQAKRGGSGKRRSKGAPTSGLGLGLRVAVDLVAALAVGVAIGYGLDAWWGTKPWMMLLFFILGSVAGILNVFKMMAGYGASVGYPRPEDEESRSETEQDRSGKGH